MPDPETVRVADLPLDPRFAKSLADAGFDRLWPSQSAAAPAAARGDSLVLAVPTASGKSLVSYLALIERALKGGKGLYLVPLRALASEKFEELQALAKPLGLRVAISIGDLDSSEPQLGDFDIIVCTVEKADALLRHRAHWLSRIRAIVADEVHLMNDAGRGPTMEVLLARFRQLNPDVQVVALSATVANSREMADWLRAEHFASTWRPVTLNEGIHLGKAVKFTDNRVHELRSDLDDPVLALAEDAIVSGGQCLVFVNTRRSTEAVAEKLAAKSVKQHLDAATKQRLKEAAASIKAGEDVTTVEGRLAKCLQGGSAFHHAGLRNDHRALVERLFKEGALKALSATPTLAAGVNLPARRVVIRDLTRYDADVGQNVPIPVMEYKQMAGRAGRPKYDKVGEAVAVAKSSDQAAGILTEFILADPERVESKLGVEGALRAHILASVASRFVRDEKDLDAFIEATFFRHQNAKYRIQREVGAVVDFLIDHDLLEQDGERFAATRFGKRVSELYIDPLSAVKLREALACATEADRAPTTLAFLHAVSATPDVRSLFVRRSDAWLEGLAREVEDDLLVDRGHGADYEFFLGELKTASLLSDWTEEATEDEMTKKYQVYPGDIATKRDAAEWLLGAMEDLSRTFANEAKAALKAATDGLDRGALSGDRHAAATRAQEALEPARRWLGPEAAAVPRAFEARGAAGTEFVTYAVKDDRPQPLVRSTGGTGTKTKPDAFDQARSDLADLAARADRYRALARDLRTLGVRVREGAKAELLPLLRYRGIGRYRARRLFGAGLRGEADLKQATAADLAAIKGIGPGLAASLKKQVGGATDDAATAAPPSDAARDSAGGQRRLGDFGP